MTINIETLTSEQRLDLIESLWDSLSITPEAIPLTAAQREELDRRLDDLDRTSPTGVPMSHVLERLDRARS